MKSPIRTLLTVDETLRYIMDRLARSEGLEVRELVAHLHGLQGTVELTITGNQVVGRQPYGPDELLRRLIDNTHEQIGLDLVYLLAHLHPATGQHDGHLLVRVNAGPPTRVTIDSRAMDDPADDLLAGLPAAAEP